jgi:large subunit ribosomal protein L6
MSRIGLKKIVVPSDVEVKVDGKIITAKGKLGVLSYTVPEVIEYKFENNELTFTRLDELKTSKQLHGTTRANIYNNILGVSQGFTKQLVINGVGYRANMKGEVLELQIGLSHLVPVTPLPRTKISLKSPTEIIVEGYDKQAVGELAALIRGKRPPDHYKNKGISYLGERIVLKKGKKGAKK